MRITQSLFGITPQGEEVYRFCLKQSNGQYIEVSNYGAAWISCVIPDKAGKLGDVLLGYPTLEGYLSETCYLGATIGRFANRIAGATFLLDGKRYELDKNEGINCNHGGFSGFHKKIWKYKIIDDQVVFSLYSPNGEGGYPGNIQVEIGYRFSEDGAVFMSYNATTDQPTFLNLTNHAYFNLDGKGKILNHTLQIPAEQLLDTTKFFIPTGNLIDVKGTEFDFTHFRKIHFDHFHTRQIRWNRGYNHCFVLSLHDDVSLKPAATVRSENSGRELSVSTTYPGVLFYSGGYLQSSQVGKSGMRYTPSDGFCLETQYFPDAPNHNHFLSPIVRPDKSYSHQTIYRFRTG